jgi:hypothetical protein
MSKLSDKLKNLFAKTRNAPGKGAYPAKFEQRAFKAGQKTTAMMKNIASKSLFKKGTVGKPSNVAKSLSKELITASAAKKLRTASKIAKIGRAITPVGLGLTAANVIYDVATMSPEKKAKVKKLKTKLSKTSTKDYHADLMKMSTGGDTMLKGGQKKLDKNKDGKISGEDFKMMKAFKGSMADSKKSSQERSKLMVQLKKKISGAAISESEAEKLMNMSTPEIKSKIKNMYKGGESKGYGAARTQGEGLQDENLIPGKSLDYYKDIM